VGSLLSFAHAFDNDLQLIGRTDNSDPPNNRTFRYDEVHRLTGADGPWGPGNTCDGDTYTYDANGNRLCKGEGAAVNYFYVTGTNRLDYSSGGESVSYDYDENGNTIEDGAHTFEYSDANRLFAVYGGSTASYAYDADGRRVIKRFQGATTYFFYDPQGRLLTEFSPGTKVGKDYIYLEGAPVGRIDWEEGLIIPPPLDGPGETEGGTPGGMWHSSLYFYHADQLGTPIAMTDANGGLVWQAEYLPFGDLWELPLSVVSNNLRFPGQYLDSETGLHQNGFRDYSSPLGRYVEADPIGLAGGLNLYAYAAGSPTRKTDRRGLDNVGCDTFDESVQTPCRLECCAIHDECYDRNKCSCESWKAGRTPCDRSAACAACNNTVAVCWLVCADRLKDDPSRPNYYCAMQHRYVRIPGDFDTLDQARKACEHDHSSDCRLRELLPLPPTPRPGNPI
jgi:RHS repeat-associated protein